METDLPLEQQEESLRIIKEFMDMFFELKREKGI